MCLITYGTYIISFETCTFIVEKTDIFQEWVPVFSCAFPTRLIIWFLKSQKARRRLHTARDRCLDSNKMQYIKSGKEESEKKSVKSRNRINKICFKKIEMCRESKKEAAMNTIKYLLDFPVRKKFRGYLMKWQITKITMTSLWRWRKSSDWSMFRAEG